MAECYSCALDAAAGAGARLRVYLYRGVRDPAAVRRAAAAGRCALVRPRLVLAPLQLAAAANRAALAAARGALVTRSVHAELLYNLSPSNKISQSLARFGAGAGAGDAEDLLLCFVTAEGEGEDARAQVLAELPGEPRPLAELAGLTSLPDLKAAYELDKLDFSSRDDLLDIIVSRIATKNIK